MADQKRERKDKVAHIDWPNILNIYLTTDVELNDLSFESSGDSSMPAYRTLRRKAQIEKWKAQKSERNAKAILAARKTDDLDITVDGELQAAKTKLIQAETIIRRHTDIADGFLRVYAKLQPRIEKLLDDINLDVFIDDPIGLSTFMKNMNLIAKDTIEIERKVLGLPDLKIDLLAKVETETKVTLDVGPDLDKLDDQALSNLYFDKMRKVDVE
jgi:hypothetical protein